MTTNDLPLVKVGRPLAAAVMTAVRADRPVLLRGPHGVGKSDAMRQAAAGLGVECRSVNLAVLEPTDLTGLPRLGEDGRTHYAPPDWLPHEGAGILFLDELNRCPRHMQAPAFLLLTERRLNGYRLPGGWVPCAAINDAEDGYLVEELDPALLSRFVQLRVVADVDGWLEWALEHGLHGRVVEFVADSPGVFDNPQSNPRAWHYACDLLAAWERDGARDTDTLAALLAGAVGATWAAAFLRTYEGGERPLKPAEVLDGYPALRTALRRWVRAGQLDLAAATWEQLRRYLQAQRAYAAVASDATRRANVEAFFRDLPADLRQQVREWLAERGFDGLQVAESGAGGTA